MNRMHRPPQVEVEVALGVKEEEEEEEEEASAVAAAAEGALTTPESAMDGCNLSVEVETLPS